MRTVVIAYANAVSYIVYYYHLRVRYLWDNINFISVIKTFTARGIS